MQLSSRYKSLPHIIVRFLTAIALRAWFCLSLSHHCGSMLNNRSLIGCRPGEPAGQSTLRYPTSPNVPITTLGDL